MCSSLFLDIPKEKEHTKRNNLSSIDKNIKIRITNFNKLLEIAKNNNWKLLSSFEDYKNSRRKLKFECKCGYIWKTTPSIIKSGSWCPKCGK